MSTIKALGSAFVVVALNGLIGHFFPPIGVLLTPVVALLTTAFVCFSTQNLNLFSISGWTFLFIALNDVFIKLYAGGTHDTKGLGVTNLLTIIGFTIGFLIILVTLVKNKRERAVRKVLSSIVYASFCVIYLQLYGNLGLGRSY